MRQGVFGDRGQLPGVSILIRPFDRMRLGVDVGTTPHLLFQSSSGLSTGCDSRPGWRSSTRISVSILIRPFDRMRPHYRSQRSFSMCGFQSSSGLSTGCDRVKVVAVPLVKACFNPHPAFRPDATGKSGLHQLIGAVSILIRPFDRMRPALAALRTVVQAVSILIRPFDRMRLVYSYFVTRGHMFQSSSGLSTGCDMLRRYSTSSLNCCFNPHPAFRPDATQDRSLLHHGLLVSILIRPFDRMRPGPPEHHTGPGRVSILIRPFDRMRLVSSLACHPAFRFQSSSGLSTGCDETQQLRFAMQPVSILIRPFDRMRLARRLSRRIAPGFNPHPAFRPDATSPIVHASRLLDPEFQSSSGLSTGCDMRNWSPTATAKGFNPHPAFRPDATDASRSRR